MKSQQIIYAFNYQANCGQCKKKKKMINKKGKLCHKIYCTKRVNHVIFTNLMSNKYAGLYTCLCVKKVKKKLLDVPIYNDARQKLSYFLNFQG